VSSPAVLATPYASLGPLIAQYARGTEGASEVLKDALLEHGVVADLFPDGQEQDVSARLHNAAMLLSRYGKFRVGCTCAKSAIERSAWQLTTQNRSVLTAALAELERGIVDPAWVGPEAGSRQAVFQVWREMGRSSAHRATSRAVWSVWMLMRDMPLVALQALRSIDENEIETQINAVAELLNT
jgi:hypothetical protein